MRKARKAIGPAAEVRSQVGGDLPLEHATVSQTKNHLSALLDRVRQGRSILIVDRDRPVARLVPVVATGDQEEEGLLRQLERAGIIRRGSGDPRALAKTWAPVEVQDEADILETLLAERREDSR